MKCSPLDFGEPCLLANKKHITNSCYHSPEILVCLGGSSGWGKGNASHSRVVHGFVALDLNEDYVVWVTGQRLRGPCEK